MTMVGAVPAMVEQHIQCRALVFGQSCGSWGVFLYLTGACVALFVCFFVNERLKPARLLAPAAQLIVSREVHLTKIPALVILQVRSFPHAMGAVVL